MSEITVANRVENAQDLEIPDRVVWIGAENSKRTAWMDGIPVRLELNPKNGSAIFKGAVPGLMGVEAEFSIARKAVAGNKKRDEMQFVGLRFGFVEEYLQIQREVLMKSKVARAIIDYAKTEKLTIIVPSQLIENTLRREVEIMRHKKMLRGRVGIELRKRYVD